MRKKESRRERWILAAATVLAIAVVGALIWGFWRQVRRLQELAAAEAELVPLVTHEKQRNEELRRLLDHVSSPGYPEEWARVHAGMTRPGEVRLVVLLPEEPALPSPEPPSAPSPSQGTSSTPFWLEIWQQLFSGEEAR